MAAITKALPERSNTFCLVCGTAGGACRNSNACITSKTDHEGRARSRYVGVVRRGLDPTRVLLAELEALDLLGIGWLVCDSRGRVVATDRRAKHILESQDGLELDSERVLRATEPTTNSIQRIVRRAASARSISASTQTSATLVPRLSDKRPFTVLVRGVQRTMTAEQLPRRLALVLITNPELAVDIPPAELHQLYGLTPMEATLTTALANGKNLEKSCKDLNITRLTGRSHLDSVFKKTGVRRQSQLISLVLKSIGLARLGNKKTQNWDKPVPPL